MVKKASRHQGIEASMARALVFVRSRSRGRGGLLPQASSRKPQAFSARGFTLVELMIAVAILIVVIVATAKLFGTVSKVTGLGQASSDILQEAAAIERQIRNDFARLAPEGFFAIRSVAVPNDINVPLGPLLNPGLLDDAMIRADQLVFFANGVAGTQVFAASSGSNRKQQGTAARIYYGHGFQLPDLTAGADPTDDVMPWFTGQVQTTMALQHFVAPIPARQWLLARQSVLLADDGGSTDFYLLTTGGINSTATIWDAAIRNSRLDIAASQLNDIRAAVVRDGTVPWIPDQRDTIVSAVFYPRAERVAPSMNRLDHALTTNVLAGACSSFIVEWTYADGVGRVEIPSEKEQPWFGMKDLQRGVKPLVTWVNDGDILIGTGGIDPDDIDPPVVGLGPASPVDEYEAFFGYDRPLTPWPSAIRITMTLHDTATRLEAGREIQFVINLPRRIE